jgi:beta-mannosidase
LHLGVIDDGLNGLTLHAVNEQAQPRAGHLGVALYRDGEWPVASAQRPLTLPPRSAQAWALTDWLDGFTDASWAYRFGPPPADVLVLRWDDGTRIVEHVHFIDAAGAVLRRADIGLHGRAEVRADGAEMHVTLGCRAAARAVHFEVDGWSAEDEYFDLAPGATRTLRFLPWPGHPRRPWRATVSAVNAVAPEALPLRPAAS